MTVKNFLPKGFQPGPTDVIIGRGKQSYNHKGNLNLRRIVASRLEEYSATTTKKGKTQIISSIIDEIRTSKPEGTFLRHEKGEGYFVVGNFLSSDKISQTFRDLLRGHYKSSNAYKRNKRRLQRKKANTVQPPVIQTQTNVPFPFQQSFAHSMPLRQNTDLATLMQNRSFESTQLNQSKQVGATFLNSSLSNQISSSERNTDELKSIAFRRISLGMNPLHGLSHIAMNEDTISDCNESNVVSSDDSISDSSTVGTKSKCDNDSDCDVSVCEDVVSSINFDDQWSMNLGKLETFYKKNGFNTVPSQSNSPENSKLSKWIEAQRFEFLNFYEGRHTSMTAMQVVQLEKLGFSKYLRRD